MTTALLLLVALADPQQPSATSEPVATHAPQSAAKNPFATLFSGSPRPEMRPLSFTIPAERHGTATRDDDREIVCGMVVVKKSPATDPRILLPPGKTGAAVRRVEPQGCGTPQASRAK